MIDHRHCEENPCEFCSMSIVERQNYENKLYTREFNAREDAYMARMARQSAAISEIEREYFGDKKNGAGLEK